MEPVVLVRTGMSTPGRAATHWATEEARMRGVVLRVPRSPSQEPGRASVIVCGVSRGDVAAPFSAGSPIGRLVGTADAPVVLVPDDLSTSRHRTGVALAVDARRPSDAALGFAFHSARLRGVRLNAVHTWTLPADAAEWPFGVPEKDRATWEDHEVQLLADAIHPWREKYPDVQVLEDVRSFAPAQALLHCSEHAQLVVIGHGLGTVAWGDAARPLLLAATCPVAVVPS